MNVEGQHNPKDVECIPVESLEVLPSGADWQSRHLESERRKADGALIRKAKRHAIWFVIII